MPSRKQRRRREKAFRHEYGYVTYDEEGNEIELERLSEVREKKERPERSKPAAKGGSSRRGGRPLREPPMPSWGRSLRRGGMWGGIMLVVILLFFKGQSLGSRLAVGVLYAAAFVPLTYWIDRLAYRNYLRRSGKA